MIKDLKELEKLLKLCRKQGVLDLSWDGVSFKLGSLPSKPNANGGDEELEEQEGVDPMTGLTQEQLMFYSAPPGPQE